MDYAAPPDNNDRRGERSKQSENKVANSIATEVANATGRLGSPV